MSFISKGSLPFLVKYIEAYRQAFLVAVHLSTDFWRGLFLTQSFRLSCADHTVRFAPWGQLSACPGFSALMTVPKFWRVTYISCFYSNNTQRSPQCATEKHLELLHFKIELLLEITRIYTRRHATNIAFRVKLCTCSLSLLHTQLS